jgi:CRISPR/Cas system CSM-associated protein Csm3 (group 7 of RAMP superfamily)
MFDVFKNRLEISGVLTTVTALRISQGRSTEPIGSDLPVVKDSLGKPLIPGSSFKGALRSRLESFLRGILGNDSKFDENPDLLRKLVANPSNEAEWALTANEAKVLKNMSFNELVRLCWVNDLKQSNQISQDEDWEEFLNLPLLRLAKIIQFKSDLEARRPLPPSDRLEYPEDLEHIDKFPESQDLEDLKQQYQSADAALTKAIACETDLASMLFGSPWVSSKFQVRDLTVLPDTWFGQYQERDGVSIDRDTETASEGKLYDFQVVPAGTPFEFKAVVENAEDWELGLLMVGFYQFENEMIPLGGGRSRGLGVVKLQLDEMIWVNPSNPQDLIEYLRHLVEGQLQSYIKTPQQIEDLKQRWSTSLLNHLTQLSTGERIHA